MNMFRKPYFVTIVATLYFSIYQFISITGYSELVNYFMFGGAPFLLLWLAFTIVRHGKYTGPELKENEEWGYQDKDKDSLGTF